MARRICWIGPLSLIFLAIGCQRLPDRPVGMPELTPCTIYVTFGGEKLAGVGVLLQPKDAAHNPWPGGGQTDTQGKAVIKTAGYYPGVVPGDYFVLFQKYAPEEFSADGMALPAKPLIPLKYSRGNSPETVTVTKDKSKYVFQLDGLENSAAEKN